MHGKSDGLFSWTKEEPVIFQEIHNFIPVPLFRLHDISCVFEHMLEVPSKLALPQMLHTAPLKADQRLESTTSPPPQILIYYLSVVHWLQWPVFLALLTIVFTVKPRDKLTLCYKALKTWRLVYTHCGVGVMCVRVHSCLPVYFGQPFVS